MRYAWSLAGLGLATAMGLGLMIVERGTADDRAVDVRVGGTKVEVRKDSADGPGFYRATEMIGTVIKDEANEPIGTVQDLVIDGHTQEVQYLLLAEGEAVANASEFIVVPYSIVTPHFVASGDRYFVVGFARSRFSDAPRITVAQLGNYRETAWMGTTNQFFGVNVRIGDRNRGRRDGGRRDGDRRDNTRQDGDSRNESGSNRDADSNRGSDSSPDANQDGNAGTKTEPKRETTPRTTPKSEPKSAPKAETKPAPKTAPPAEPKATEPAPKKDR